MSGYMDDLARSGMTGAEQIANQGKFAQTIAGETQDIRAGMGAAERVADQIGAGIGGVAGKAGGALMSPMGNLAMTGAMFAPMFMAGGGGGGQAPAESYSQPMPAAMPTTQAQAYAMQQPQPVAAQQQVPGLSYETQMREQLRLAKEQKKLEEQQALIAAQRQMYGGQQ
jgi:hypothetical protein